MNWVKLNFDDVAKKEGSTGRGMFRDSKGRMLLAYLGQLGKVSNNNMEFLALYWGLILVISMGWRNVVIEDDSKIIIKNIKGNMREGWAIKCVIEDIRHLLAILIFFYLNHIFLGWK